MLRSCALWISLAAAVAAVAPPSIARAEAPAPEPVAFPLPKDASPAAQPTAPGKTKAPSARIQLWNVPRAKPVVTTEVRAALRSGKWEIVKDEPSPSGTATRIQAKKDGRLWKASFTGDATRTVIILTVP